MPGTPPTAELRAWFLVGPTASGKTEAAQLLAERGGGEILSADAMLVYRGMDIGTAKPDAAARGRVRYHGLDLVSVGEPFSAGAWRAAALAALRAAARRGQRLLVVGGTGLYIRCLLRGLDPSVPAQPAVRAEAERLLAAGGLAALQARAREAAPARVAALADPCNPRRLVRAMEMALAGAPDPALRPAPAPEPACIPGLRWDPAALYDRIRRRVRAMYAQGFLAEVERLLQAGLDQAPTARQAIGYAEAADCLRGRCGPDEAMERTILRTRQLARRQMTWFRRQCRVDWVPMEPGMTASDAADAVRARWERHGPAPVAPDAPGGPAGGA